MNNPEEINEIQPNHDHVETKLNHEADETNHGRTSGKALASFSFGMVNVVLFIILGILGLCMLPLILSNHKVVAHQLTYAAGFIFLVIIPVFIVLGLVFGLSAHNRSKITNHAKNKTVSLIGICMSSTFILVYIVLSIYVLDAFYIL